MTITPLHIIERAASLLSNAERWRKFVFLAANEKGREVGALDASAVQFSIIGALRRAAHELGLPADTLNAPTLWAAYDRVEAALPPHFRNLEHFNNYTFTTHTEVMQLLESVLNTHDRKAA